jgi:hypothetical protein
VFLVASKGDLERQCLSRTLTPRDRKVYYKKETGLLYWTKVTYVVPWFVWSAGRLEKKDTSYYNEQCCLHKYSIELSYVQHFELYSRTLNSASLLIVVAVAAFAIGSEQYGKQLRGDTTKSPVRTRTVCQNAMKTTLITIFICHQRNREVQWIGMSSLFFVLS